MKKTSFLTLLIALSLGSLLNAWEEDPRIEDHNQKTSYLLKLCNQQIEDDDEETIGLLACSSRERQKLSKNEDDDDEG